MWLDIQLPILLRENSSFLAHAITIAEEAEQQRQKLKCLAPVLPLPHAIEETTPPAEWFFLTRITHLRLVYGPKTCWRR